MPLTDGDPAEQHDVWTRIIIVADHWNSDGTIHNGAFSGRNVISRASAHRHWAHELSGSLLSFIPHLRSHIEDFCATYQREFHGTMFQIVENLRTAGTAYPRQSPFPTDVRYTPLPDNNAHSDLVTFHTTDDHRHEIRDWLQEMIQAVKPDRLIAVCSMRDGPNFPRKA